MLTLNNILEEIKNVPINRLEEFYQFVHSLTPQKKPTDLLRKKILSFGGAFNDMSNKDYADYLSEIKKVRTQFFDRKINNVCLCINPSSIYRIFFLIIIWAF